MSTQRCRTWDWLTCGLLGVCLITMLCTFRHYGIGWDEAWQSSYGERAIRWYTSGFTDRGALDYKDLMYYGSFFEILAQLATRISPLDRFETRHLVNALFGLLGLVGAAMLGRALRNPATGFLAALFLALTPVYWGNSFFNSKDLPFAALFVISFAFLLRWFAEFPVPRLATSLEFAIAVGLTLAVKVGGVLLVGYAALAVVFWLLNAYLGRTPYRGDPRTFWRSVRRLGVHLAAIAALSYGVMIIWWPYAQVDPLRNPTRALLVMGRFPKNFSMLFEGRQVLSHHLPWDYVGKWVLISMPEFLLLALAIGGILGCTALIRIVKTRDPRGQWIPYALLLIALLGPVGLVASGRTPVYDGLRHLLFLVPLVAVLAAASVTILVERSRSKWLTRGVLGLLVVSLVVTVVDYVQLHPYESLYFNRMFGGGLARAAKSYETDYWGISLREGALWIVENVPEPLDDRMIRVASCGGPESASHYLTPAWFEFIGAPGARQDVQPDLFLGMPRGGCDQLLDGTILHVVTRQGAPLLYVKQVNASTHHSPD